MSLDKYKKKYLKRKSLYSISDAESFIDYFCDKHLFVYYQNEAYLHSVSSGDEAIFNFIYGTIRDTRKKRLVMDMLFLRDFDDLPLYLNRFEDLEEVIGTCKWRLQLGK